MALNGRSILVPVKVDFWWIAYLKSPVAQNRIDRRIALITKPLDDGVLARSSKDVSSGGAIEANVGSEDPTYMACGPSDATMMTRECSGSFTLLSSGRTKPFSTTPATATG